MSFSSLTKDELIRLPLEKECCMMAELSSLLQTSGSLQLRGGGRVRITFRVEKLGVARRILLLLRSGLHLMPKLHYIQHSRLGGRRTCVLTLDDDAAQTLLIAMRMIEQDDHGGVTLRRMTPKVPLTRQCCLRSFLRGAFLGAGTMSDPDKDYHFELVAGEENLAYGIAKALEKFELPVHIHERRGKLVTYLKGSQQISDVLTLMGASKATMDFENVRITKELRNQVNRASNCDWHNSEKQVSAAARQVDAIKLISIQRGLFTLPPSLQEMARLRLEHPEETIEGLGLLLTPPLSKSAVNHRLRRLSAIAADIEQNAVHQKEGSL